MRARWLITLMLTSTLSARGVAAQEAPAAASLEPDFEECTAAAAEGRKDRMEAAAARLEAAASAMEAERPADALVVRARVRSQCLIPFAPYMRKAALLEESNALLEQALQIDPRHLLARFMLGMNHYHSPTFLGRTGAAVQALEQLLADHGDRDHRVVALAYLYLGELYERQGRLSLALQTWRRGAARFPDDPALREKIGKLALEADADSIAPSRPPSAPPEDARYTLAPIVVHGSTYSVDDPRAATRLSQQEVFTLPGGTADIFQTFQTLPGVTRVAGDGGDLYVRGGDPAETPIYVDGARLFHPGRFETLTGSIFGVLDPGAMRAAHFSSGGFSARYGNALSGVVALETDRRPLERRGRANLSIASLGGTLWQPLGDRAGFWATTMLTHTGLLLKTHGRTDEYPEAPTSHQLMVGVAVEPRRGWEISASALSEADETAALVSATGYEGTFTSDAATRLVTTQVRAETPDGRGLVRLTFGASERESRFRFGVLARDREDRALDARLDGELRRERVTFRAGLEGALLDAWTDGIIPASDRLAPGSPAVHLDGETDQAHHVGGYTEVEWRALDRLAIVAGLRADELPGEDRVTLDPRLAAAYKVGDWTFRLGGGLFSQGRWRTRYVLPDGGSPAGVPRRAEHLVAGFQHDGAPALRVEAYVKRYDDYVAEAGNVVTGPPIKAGRAAGLDVLLRPQAVGPLHGWLTYSYLKAELELEDGARVPSQYDVTHSLTAVAKLSFGASELGFTARYATGRPFTPILGAAPSAPGEPPEPIYGPLHSRRMPDYFRLDGRLTQLLPFFGGGVLIAFVEALNLLDRDNVTMYTYDAAYQNRRPVPNFFGDRIFLVGVEARL
mgnify:CR=1 FL=1